MHEAKKSDIWFTEAEVFQGAISIHSLLSEHILRHMKNLLVFVLLG